MTIDEELFEIVNGGKMWVTTSDGRQYNKGLDVAGLKGLRYFIKFYLARGNQMKYDAWLDCLRYNKSIPPEIQKAALELYLCEGDK